MFPEAVWQHQASDTFPAERRSTRARGSQSKKVKSKLQGLQGPWVLLSNISHSSHAMRLSDEIDQVVIGPQGVFVVEVKHWDSAWLRQNPHVAEGEADRINDKAKRVAGKLKTAFDPGFVAPRFLLTRGGKGMQAGQRINVRGVQVFGLSELHDLVNADGASQLAPENIERAALLLEPAARVALTGDLRSFAGLINLERLPTPDAPFHRTYRGQHPTRRDKVILHLYDLSATDEKDAENRARREYEVLQQWQKSPYLPSLLDSFQEAERFPGELYWFSLIDPAAPTLAHRAEDPDWSLNDRLRYAREALLALGKFHQPDDQGLQRILHRHITPRTCGSVTTAALCLRISAWPALIRRGPFRWPAWTSARTLGLLLRKSVKAGWVLRTPAQTCLPCVPA
ncbi:hypothetical protein E4Q23_11340 [Candidatus Accumulibacter phosphatis]|uniref:NERD domain-containing protein n=1 Tax=Candidatus Accumulibacter phosphatis TaxID=327160 RepID=A0ABX1U072_9PROT|nr:nuclease-related domain-containing protein [Candidatus Accumulibacter phosphatis]NMQ28293.1 hypothetical protein [Candidatus Accumulibacter phosphatis]